MLNFLNPTVLFALSAGFLPLIIHLLNRRKVKEVEFSTIHFLKKMVKKEMRRLKIRQILLLIIRTLIILLLVLTFARPTLRSNSSFLTGRTASEVIIIIDNSLSLNSLELNGNLLERLRQRWITLESVVESDDRITVIFGVKPLKILIERERYSRELWEKISKEIQPSYQAGNLTEALQVSSEIFRKSELFNKELYILSDFQKSGINLDELGNLKSVLPERILTFCLPIKHKMEENIAVDSVSIVNRLVEKNHLLKIKAVISNRNSEKHLTSMNSLVIENNRVAQKNISLAANEQKQVSFQTTIQKDGFVKGFIEAENDVLVEDNRFYFNFFIPQQVNILHFYSESAKESFIPLIIKPAINRGYFKLDQKEMENWASIDFSQYHSIILEGTSDVNDALVKRLDNYTQSNNGLIIVPDKNTTPAKLNLILAELNMGNSLTLRGNPGQTDDFVTMGDIDWNHPVFEGLFEERKNFNPPFTRAYYQIKPHGSNDIIIKFKNGDPFLTESGSKTGTIYLLTTPMDFNWSNLVIRGFVVPLIYRMIYHAATRRVKERISIRVGEAFSGLYRVLKPPYEFRLIHPSGLEEKISHHFKGADVLLRIEQNLIPGNYEIWQGNKLLSIYSVNHTEKESSQVYMTKDNLEEIFPDVNWILPAGNLEESVKKSRFGFELWLYLLGLVFILLFIEMIIAYIGGSKEAKRLEHQVAGS